MNVDAYFRWLENELESVVETSLNETTASAESLLKAHLPTQRVKTKRAVYRRLRKHAKGIRATIGLRFSKTYRSHNTETQRLWQQAWRQTRPAVSQHFHQRFTANLKGL